MKKYINPSKESWEELLKRPAIDEKDLNTIILDVVNNILLKGDEALRSYARKFDGVDLKTLLVTKDELLEAEGMVSDDLKDAINLSKGNIEKFHQSQNIKEEKVETTKGVLCWRESRAIENVGLYIPGGSAPLFSTILMLAIPAKIAGCKNIVLCTPPSKDGSIHPAMLYTANLIGVDKIIKSGGAQAIASMAYGTKSVPKVDKIFGPGNQYVTAAKQYVSQHGVAIDMPAGPSEVQVIADESANPEFVASDLLSQAEHGKDSQVILVATSDAVAENCYDAVSRQLADLPRKAMAEVALENSKVIVLTNKEDIIALTNIYGPEHLIIATRDYKSYVSEINNAGSVFLGNFTPESAGDYASGTNHTLPTNGYAKAYSGVSLDSFVKKITFQEITKEGIQNIGNFIEIMAEEEQLFAHKNAVTLRLDELKD